MMMTEEEIRRSYREAKNQTAQITILAELNACSKEKIKEIVGFRAYKPKAQKTEAQKTEAQAAAVVGTEAQGAETEKPKAQATGKKPGRPKKFKLEEPVKEETAKEIKTEMKVQDKPEEIKQEQAAAVVIPEKVDEEQALNATICLLFKQLDGIDKQIRELEGKYRETERAIKVLTEIEQEKKQWEQLQALSPAKE